ncbi:MAG: helix-turn-helix domain-containing protein, partial [Sciscionella sp.]|nr:helix-turn-helix domain-containing protein [Sciscionella sp.]
MTGRQSVDEGLDASGVGAGLRRRAALGEFLKARRARLRPEDVGLPPGQRRRTSGLRREEVALLASVGITWYTWLEQGRPINASAQVLDAIARTLRFDRADREHMYRLAEATPMRAGVSCTGASDTLRQVLDSLDPLPATLINGRYDIVALNDAWEELFWDWHTLPCVHRNHLWCCVTEPGARDRLLNYDDEVRYMVARLRAEYGKHIGDPEWEEDIRRLADVSPEFADLWALHEVAEPQTRRKRFRHPDVGTITFRVVELAVVAAPELRIMAYTPADDETW